MAGGGGPTEPHRTFEAAYDEGDLDRATALCAPEARMATQDGGSVTGWAAVRDRLEVFRSLSGRTAMRTRFVLEAGDLALPRRADRRAGARRVPARGNGEHPHGARRAADRRHRADDHRERRRGAGRGPEQVDGVDADRYALTVDVTELPDDTPGRADVLSAGVLRLPVDLWVDERGRPVKVTQELTVQGRQLTTEVTLGDFDEPVTMTPPPPDQVATG